MLNPREPSIPEGVSGRIPIDPEHIPVGRLFDNKYIFFLPKYQRGYAWGEEEVVDYIKDIGKCLEARKRNETRHHFFGGIVSVQRDVPGAPHLNLYELVDGQQRLATTVLLISNVIEKYEYLLESGDEFEDHSVDIIRNRVDELTNQFIQFEKEVQRRIKVIELLKLSGKDEDFFRGVVRGRSPDPETNDYDEPIESHRRIQKAESIIERKISDLLSEEDNIDDKIQVLKELTNVIDEDFTVIHVVTYKRSEAYRLFQVLNDRGISLTEGDLLRANTLELLADDYPDYQNQIETVWDEILIDEPSDTEDFLRWIYASHESKRPGKTTLFEDFRDKFYPEHEEQDLTDEQATSVVDTTKEIQTEFERCRDLIRGNWPFTNLSDDLEQWHKDKLDLLLDKLGHTNCVSLLLAACKLNQTEFYRIVDLTERFFFRYKIVCNQHIGSLNSRYRNHAKKIRDDPSDYDVSDYRDELRKLQNEKAGDDLFSSSFFERMQYNPGASNKYTRYFLLSCEFYWRWFNDGCDGYPHPQDFTRRIDFSTTSVEHIYPQSADDNDVSEDIENMKHDIGNLTLLGEDDNQSAENSTFDDKSQILRNSALLINNDVASNDEWNINQINNRRGKLSDMALSIFTV